MSNLELKGGILEMIATIDDRESLAELKKIVSDFLGNHIKGSDYWDELSIKEQAELDTAIELSKEESNHIDHSEVMKKYKKWLGK